MTLLESYLFRKTLSYFFYTALSFLFLFVVIDLFEHLQKFLNKDFSFLSLIQYYACLTPSFFLKITPFSLLISFIFLWKRLTSTNEIIAFKSLGVNMYRFLLPFGFLSLGLFIVSECLSHWAIPHLKKRAMQIHKTSSINTTIKNATLKNGSFFYFVEKFHTKTQTMDNIVILETDPQKQLSLRIDALHGQIQNNELFLKNCVIYKNSDQKESNKKVQKKSATRVFFPQKLIHRLEKHIDPSFMNTHELLSLIRSLKNNGYAYLHEKILLHFRLSFPFSNIIILLIGIPFMMKNRNQNQSFLQRASVSIGWAFFYQLCFLICLSLGHNEILSPFTATWVTQGIFLIAGLTLLRTIHR